MWAMLDSESAGFVTSARVDIAMIIEEDEQIPPVLFKEFSGLTSWADAHELVVQKLSKRKIPSAVRVHGQYRIKNDRGSFYYDQIWVKAVYTRYASALQKLALQGFNVEKHELGLVHADHVINRARLKEYPDAWVCIFPVHRDANSPFGNIEYSLADIPPEAQRVDLPPIVALKLFCDKLPKTLNDLKLVMVNIRGQIRATPLGAAYCDQIEREAQQYVIP